MSHTLSITMPCGQLKVYMGIHQLMPTIAHQVVRGEVVHTVMPTDPSKFIVTETEPPTEASYKHKVNTLLEVADFKRRFLERGRLDNGILAQEVFSFMAQRFKNAVAKKSTEFHISDLDLKAVENLGIKYMENFGSEEGSICLFKLSDYHKFAAMVDAEAFRFYRNEQGTHGELVEMRPDRWVLGRYDNDMKIIQEMASMRQYDAGGYWPGGSDGRD